MHAGSTPSVFLNVAAFGHNGSVWNLNSVKSFGIMSNYKVLHLSLDGPMVGLVMIDSVGVLRRLKFNIQTEIVTSQQISSPVPFLSHYASVTRADFMPFSKDWDEFLVGVTSSLFVENKTFTLRNQIGFAFGLTQNRKTPLLAGETPMLLTSDLPTTTDLLAAGLSYYSELVAAS